MSEAELERFITELEWQLDNPRVTKGLTIRCFTYERPESRRDILRKNLAPLLLKRPDNPINQQTKGLK